MKFAVRSRPAPTLPGVHGPARLHRRTTSLLGRLQPGDVAVLDHLDMDRDTAQALIDAGVVAVVNASPMISGRYPNLGPELLVQAGVTVVDSAGHRGLRPPQGRHRGPHRRGSRARRRHPGRPGPRAHRRRRPAPRWARRPVGLTAQLESFTHNTTEFLRREQDLLLHGHGIPRTATDMAGRPVVVVVRSHGWEDELRGIRPFVREQRPAPDRGRPRC